MRTECAVLCDAANVREGLLNIIGGGISTVTFQGFPAALPLIFAVRVVMETRELRDQIRLRLELVNAVNEQAVEGEAEVVFSVMEPREVSEEAAIATAVPLGQFQVARPGKYLIKAWLNDHSLGTFPVRVVKAGG